MQIFVLGMHRSGTSVAARLLNMAGAYVGPEGALTAPNSENPKGFWERADVRAINDELLHSTGCDWDRITAFTLDRVSEQVRAKLDAAGRKILLGMDAYRPWVLKEPRFCVTLPFWQALSEFPVAVHVFRDPLEVAISLRSRNGIPIEAGLALWEHYVIAQAGTAQGIPGSTIFHADLMSEPRLALRSVIDELREAGCRGLNVPGDVELSRFISPGLHRSQVRDWDGELPESTLGIWNALKSKSLAPVQQMRPSAWAKDVLQNYEQRSLAAGQAKKAAAVAEQARARVADIERQLDAHARQGATLVDIVTAIAARVGVGGPTPAWTSGFEALSKDISAWLESATEAVSARIDRLRHELERASPPADMTANLDAAVSRLAADQGEVFPQFSESLTDLQQCASRAEDHFRTLDERLARVAEGIAEAASRMDAIVALALDERLDSVAEGIADAASRMDAFAAMAPEIQSLTGRLQAAENRALTAERSLGHAQESLRRTLDRVHSVAELYTRSFSYRAARLVTSPLRLIRGGGDAIAYLRTVKPVGRDAPGHVLARDVGVQRPSENGPDTARAAKLGIVVLTLDGAALLERLLSSLARYPPSVPFEVCVTDHGSKDSTASVLERAKHELPVRAYFAGQNHSFAYSNNRWAEQLADCTHLLFLNNDIVFEEGVLDRMLSALDDRRIGVVGIDQRNEPGHSGGEWHHLGVDFRWDVEYSFWRPCNITKASDRDEDTVEVAAVTGSVLVVRREDFLQIGGFHERYNYGYEDVDLCLAMRAQLGLGSVCLRSNGVVHADGATRRIWSGSRTRKSRRANIEVLRMRSREWMRSWWVARFGAAHCARRSARPVVAFAVTEVGENAAAGDLFTATELGTELSRRYGWEVQYRPTGDSWYNLADVDVVIAMVDSYDPRRISHAHPFLTRVAWCRNWFDRWCDRPGFESFDLWLASSSKSARYIADRIGTPERVLRIATSLAKFNASARDEAEFDFVFTGSYWGAARDIVAAAETLQSGLRGAVFGKNWERVPEIRALHKGFLPYAALPDVYRKSHVVIDDANHVTKPWGSVNSRVFDALASGCLVITNSEEASRDAFSGQLPVYKNGPQLRQMLEQFGSDEELRSSTVQRLRSAVVREHTYSHRAVEFTAHLRAHLRGRIRVALKIPVPDREQAAEWGDYHFASSLARELRRRGCVVRLDFLREWHDPRSVADDVTLVLRGLNEYVPADGENAFLWVISHPDKLTDEELSRYSAIFVASSPFARTLQGRTSRPVFVLLQCTDSERFGAPSSGLPASAGQVLFVGNSRNVFRPVVRDAIAAGLAPDIYGTRWGRFVDSRLVKGENVPNEDLPTYYRNALVVLNDHWPDMAKLGFLSNRLFDAVAAGAVIVSDRCEGIEEVFGEAVQVYESPEHLAMLVGAVAREPAAARTRVELATARVLADHTFAQRADVLVEHMHRILACSQN